MKNYSNLLLISAAAIVIFITSCSTEKGLTLEKRHYRKGYSIAWHGKKQSTEVDNQMLTSNSNNNANAAADLEKMPTIILESVTTTQSNDLALVANGSQIANTAIQTESNKQVVKKHVTEKTTKAAEPKMSFTKAEKKEMRKFLTKQAPCQTDMPLWAYVLIAILLPPLAVALYEGIVSHFWICLVLTFIFWIPGIIYAMWRVLRNE